VYLFLSKSGASVLAQVVLIQWGNRLPLTGNPAERCPVMAEILNLRTIRKRAKRQQDAERAATNRLAFGRSKANRALASARDDKADRILDQHRIETGDDR
jgi:hypothetical protein